MTISESYIDSRYFSILIAEDNIADREILRRVIKQRKTKCSMIEEDNGESVIKYLDRSFINENHLEKPDLLLLDINMPKLDGFAVLKLIRSSAHYNMLPVIMFSTSKRKKDIDKSYSLGANAFISKPMDYSDFVSMFDSLEKFWFQNVLLPSKNPLD